MSRKTRKLIWAVPLVAVFAVVGALAIFAAQPADPAEAHGPPGTVTGVTATPDGATKIKISWTAPASGTGGAPTGYRIDVSDDTLVWKALVADTGNTDTSYTHMGLKPETGKYYLVFALNSAGAGPSSVDPLYAYAMTGGATAPSAVLNLRAKAVGSSKIELSWDPPAQDGHADIDYYCIVADDVEAGTTTDPLAWPTSYDNVVDPTADPVVANTEVNDACTATAQANPNGILDNSAGTSPTFADGFLIVVDGEKTTYDLMGATLLSESQHWRFRAYAKNSAGTSSAVSNTARARLADTPDTGKPTDVRVALSSSQTAGDTTANDLTDDTWAYGTSFQVYFNWPVVDGKAATVGGFQYQSRVTDAAGTWPAWESTVTSTNTTPVEITATAPAGPHQAEISVPGTFDGAGDRFQVRLRVVRTHNSDVTADTTGPGSWVESNIIVHQGTGTERGETTANRVPLRVPGPVTGLDADDDKSLNEINLKWDRGSDATYSSIDVSEGGIVWTRLERNTKWARETYNHRNVKPGSDFTYRVTPGHNRWGLGLAVIDMGSTQPAVEPAPVRGLTVTANGQDMLDLNWPLISEANDGGSPIVGYLVQVNSDDDDNATLDSAGTWSSVNTTTVSGATVTDGAAGGSYTYAADDMPLTAGSVRWFRVFAVNTVNATDAPTADDRASAEPKMGKTAAPAKPGAPVGLVAETARDANSDERTELGVDLLWNQGDLAAGDTIKGYVVDRKVNGGEWESLLPTGSSNTGDDYTRFTDEDEPEANEMRAYRVAAVASDGQGPWSNVAYYPGMHTADTPHNAAPMAGDAIDPQTVMVDGTVMVQSTITDADGDTLTWSVDHGDGMYATATVDNMGMVTITGVMATMANMPATITVTATDMDGSGMSAMQEIMVTVTAAPMELMPPSNVRVNPVGSGLVNVGWDGVSGAAGYTIVAVNIADTSEVVTESVNNPNAAAGQIGNLTVGAEYNIYVGSFDANLDFALDFSEKKRVTVE